jgi:hypothetical protein
MLITYMGRRVPWDLRPGLVKVEMADLSDIASLNSRIELVDVVNYPLVSSPCESLRSFWVLHPDGVKAVVLHVLLPDLLEDISRNFST